MNDTNRSDLKTYLESYGIASSEEQRTQLFRHLELVIEKNTVMNLTRITEPSDAIVRHIVDSLLILPSVQMYHDTDGGRFLDIGTGGGYPGIPLAIMTDMTGLLIDSVGKKAHAVSGFIKQLGLDRKLSAQAIRVEDLARREPASFDVITARAVAELGVLVEYASPLLVKTGKLIVSKANISDHEFNAGIKTASMTGLSFVSRETYELPHDCGHREIMTFEKNKKSSVQLPRQTGMAKHKPLVPFE